MYYVNIFNEVTVFATNSGLFYIFAIQFFQMSALIEGSWISVYLSAFNWLRCYLLAIFCNFIYWPFGKYWFT